MIKLYTALFFMTFSLISLAQTVDAPSSNSATPVLVELFTSEGCSSCPPADRLLEELDSKQPIAGVQVIALSEHVDYWDRLGWKDPYSSSIFTERQGAYVTQFGLATGFTPQMVVDGESQFTGGNGAQAQESISKAAAARKIPIKLSAVYEQSAPGQLKTNIEIEPGSGTVYLALALSHAESQVLHGENGGRHLTHVDVVQTFKKIGSLDKSKTFSKETELKLPSGVDPSNVRVIAFVQDTRKGGSTGKVIGVAEQSVR
jgi:hypothetical protein